MLHSWILSRNNCLLALGLTALVGGGVNTWASGVQKTLGGRERVIEKLYPDDSPAVVADLKVSEKTVKLGDKFDEEDNWLRHFSIQLQNNLHKPITHLR